MCLTLARAPLLLLPLLLSLPCCPTHHSQGMKVAVIEGHDIGGTCVNRGCVPSKALLAASGRIREMKNEAHMKSMGIQVRDRDRDLLTGTHRGRGALGAVRGPGWTRGSSGSSSPRASRTWHCSPPHVCQQHALYL